jgi:hypothetical protein
MIFVFGSNEAGIHGAGAALIARMHYGAVLGLGEGRSGNSYAIPTRTGDFVTLPLPEIREYVETFKRYAELHPDEQFQVTTIGTGCAGLAHVEMAPMFVSAPGNCLFDSEWKPWLPADTKFWGTF